MQFEYLSKKDTRYTVIMLRSVYFLMKPSNNILSRKVWLYVMRIET